MENVSNKARSFFERPEGKTGLLFIFLGFLVLIFAGNYIMPFIITAMQNTLHAMFLIACVVGVVGLGLNRKFQLLVENIFKSSMRLITSAFITIDPIGILKNYLEIMADKIASVEGNIMKLKGQMRKLEANIENGEKAVENHMKFANAAKKHGNNDELTKNLRMGQREKESAEKFHAILTRMTKYYEILCKIKKNLNLLHEDTEHQVKVKEIEYKSIKEAHKAMSSAEKLINGSAEKDLFDQSLEFIADDIGMKLGEMDRFMEMTQGFMQGNELKEAVWDEDGMSLLEQWESGANILEYEIARKELPAPSPALQLPSTQQSSNSKFDSFFK